MQDDSRLKNITKRGIKYRNIDMGKKDQVKQEGVRTTRCRRVGHHHNNSTTVKKLTFNSNVIDIKDVMFIQGRPDYTMKYEDPTEFLINYVKGEYSAGIYLPKKSTNHDNQ